MQESSTAQSCSQGDRLRLFQCRVCARSFMKNEHLVRHVRSHTKEKPFTCRDCGNSYSRRDILIRHRRDVKCKRPPVRQETDPAAGETSSSAAANLGTEPAGVGDTDDILPIAMSGGGQTSEQADQSQFDPDGPPPAYLTYQRAPLNAGTMPINDTHLLNRLTQVEVDGQNLLTSEQDTSYPTDLSASVFDSSCFPSWEIDPGLHDMMLEMDPALFDQACSIEPSNQDTVTVDDELCLIKKVHNIWYTQIPERSSKDAYYPGQFFEPVSGTVTGPPSPQSEGTEINDQYRQGLRKRLMISTFEPMVPSVDILNVWIRLYFTRVHPIFPIIHAATFRPCKANINLLLSMCAMGSLFTGSEQGFHHGIYLFERIRKATLLKWDRLFIKDQDSIVSIIQSALISQMFGLLSGSPLLLLTVDAFHGPPVAWARHIRRQSIRHEAELWFDESAEGSRLESMWREWTNREELLRLQYGLFIIDAELCCILHREPSQNFESYQLTSSASERAFNAPDARQWKAIFQETFCVADPAPSVNLHQLTAIPIHSSFTTNAVLRALEMEILLQRKKLSPDSTALKDSYQSLADFRRRFFSEGTHFCKSLQLSVIWHTLCMEVFADFDLLERAIGRDGCQLSPVDREALLTWVAGTDSRMCIKHALMVQKCIQTSTILSEPALHVPRALFWAFLAIFCYLRFSPHDGSVHQIQASACSNIEGPTEGDPELMLSDVEHQMVGNVASLKATLFAMIDLLEHIGHWKLSRKFAEISTLITNHAFECGWKFNDPQSIFV